MSLNSTPLTMPTYGSPATAFSLANTLVEQASALATQLQNQSYYTPFTVAFPTFTIPQPPVPIEPVAPNLIDVVWTTPTQPGAFTQAPPSIAGLFPGPLTAVQPSLNFGTAPQSFSGSIPQSPSLDFNFTYPTPSIELPSVPSLLSLDVVDFNPYDIPVFSGTAPTFNLTAPTPLNWTEAWTYTSDMLSTLQDEITLALTTDTDIGLSASVQQAMWDAGREREYEAQAIALADLERLESMGFALPHGIYLDARIKIQTDTDMRMTGLSRDIMVKQAEMRLEHVTAIRGQAITLEHDLIEYASQVQTRAFESAKYQTEAMISIYNARVQAFGAQVQAFTATIQAYDALIKGIEANIEQKKAQVEYEATKATINTAIVNQYRAEIEAALATLEIAKVQVEIIQTQANVQKTKVDAYSAQIQAFVGTVNAYTAEVEGYKASVETQGVIENVYKTQVDAYVATVQAGTAQATALVEEYKAQVQGYEAQLEGYKAALQAMVEQARAASEFNQALTAEYTAQVQAQATFNEVLVKEWQAQITEMLQVAEVEVKTAEANAQLQISERNITIEAIKGAASVMAQLGAAALGAIHWSSTANWSNSWSSSVSTSNSTANNDDHIYSESV